MSSNIIEKVKDLLDEGTEIIKCYDVLAEEVIKEKLPVVGIAFTFRDEYLVRKLVKFLEDISTLPTEKKGKVISKLQDKNGELKNKFKERIIIALDRIDLEEKITYYSKLVIMFCNEEINESLFYRCCKILENYSCYDLISFKEKEKYNFESKDDILYFSIGLLQNISQGENLGGVSLVKLTELTLSDAGNIFLKLNR